MSIPSKIPTNPIIARLEKQVKETQPLKQLLVTLEKEVEKAHEELKYWVRNHADAIEDLEKREAEYDKDVVKLAKQIKELECRLKEKK